MTMMKATRIGTIGILLALFLAGCATPTQPTYTRPAPEPPKPPPPPPAPTATANVREISRVTHDAAPERLPRVSPDAKTLVFTSLDFTKKTWGEASSVAAVSLGQAGRQLIAGPFACNPAWYPDGKHILYQYMKTQKPTLVRQPFGGVGMTFITPSAMGADDDQPHVSPDGDKIAFCTKIGNSSNICTVDSDGTDFTVFVEGFSPRWHPSKKLLAFDREVGDYGHLFLLDLSNGQVTQLTMGESEN